MICFRCGSEVAEGAAQCGNCGQRFSGARRTFTTTTTSFRALEKRRLRAQKTAEKLGYGIGDVISSRYEVRDLIGVGPLGAVYRVLDQEIDVDVALKVIHPHLLEDAASREQFSQTIRKARKLSQQNIVRLYDDDVDADKAFFTMQLLEGLTLRKVIGLRQDKGQRFTVKEIEPIMVQIAMALGHAHRHAVHGDLKPENVLILPDVLKLTDFSSWEAVPTAAFVKAQQEADAGAYLAPEMVAGGPVDLRADLYSLGAIFYELLTGRVYAPGAPPPSEVLAQAEESGPEGIDVFVSTALAANPRDRFESAEAFIEALATYIDGRELRSVDIRAPKSLLPEDVTRRVQAPAGLQDDDSLDIETPESESERSLVEELGEEDFEVERSMDTSVERSVERSSEKSAERSAEKSAERSGRGAAVPLPLPDGTEAPTRPWEAVGKPGPAADESTVDVRRQGTAVTHANSPPWFVRSNVAFVALVFLIVLGVAAGAWFVVKNAQKDRPSLRTVSITVAPDATVVAQKPAVVVEARPVAPETAAPSAAPTEPVPPSAPATQANPAPATAA
ncbi:protein kinase, partial [Myxococcota bacterium]|nr:protein kinase [Myxococcota bacterium]